MAHGVNPYNNPRVHVNRRVHIDPEIIDKLTTQSLTPFLTTDRYRNIAFAMNKEWHTGVSAGIGLLIARCFCSLTQTPSFTTYELNMYNVPAEVFFVFCLSDSETRQGCTVSGEVGITADQTWTWVYVDTCLCMEQAAVPEILYGMGRQSVVAFYFFALSPHLQLATYTISLNFSWSCQAPLGWSSFVLDSDKTMSYVLTAFELCE